MKKLLSVLFLLTTIIVVLMLTACSGSEDGVPDGMQIAGGGESDGYYFYVPEEWVVSSHGKFDAAYVSSVNNTSVSFVKGVMPTVSIAEYFENEESSFPFSITVGDRDKAVNFGNAESARSFSYTYTYDEKDFACLQVFVVHKGEFYIFTYTSYTAEYTDGQSYFDYYLEKKVIGIMESFKFIDRTASEELKEYEKDSDGYILVSDKTEAGFLMYLPDEYTVDFSGGIVSATNGDGVNVTMSKATYTSVTADEYWQNRKKELTAIVDGASIEEIEIGKQISVDGAKWALSYEYTYTLQGRSYHIYQVLIVNGQNGYVFTFSAEKEIYPLHFDKVALILKKLEF